MTWTISPRHDEFALYLPRTMYEKLLAMKMVQLLVSREYGVQKAADLCLSEEKKKQRMKFKPAALVLLTPSHTTTFLKPQSSDACCQDHPREKGP